jgi:BlaI family transcriptional regulator, penicillinase repressor
MSQESLNRLSRRERQIMEILFVAGEATAAEVQSGLPDPPSYSSVRTLLGILESKGHVHHRKAGRSFVYTPAVSRLKARRAALKSVVHTFFDGSVEDVVTALISMKDSQITADEYARLADLIERSRRQVKE